MTHCLMEMEFPAVRALQSAVRAMTIEPLVFIVTAAVLGSSLFTLLIFPDIWASRVPELPMVVTTPIQVNSHGALVTVAAVEVIEFHSVVAARPEPMRKVQVLVPSSVMTPLAVILITIPTCHSSLKIVNDLRSVSFPELVSDATETTVELEATTPERTNTCL